MTSVSQVSSTVFCFPVVDHVQQDDEFSRFISGKESFDQLRQEENWQKKIVVYCEYVCTLGRTNQQKQMYLDVLLNKLGEYLFVFSIYLHTNSEANESFFKFKSYLSSVKNENIAIFTRILPVYQSLSESEKHAFNHFATTNPHLAKFLAVVTPELLKAIGKDSEKVLFSFLAGPSPIAITANFLASIDRNDLKRFLLYVVAGNKGRWAFTVEALLKYYVFTQNVVMVEKITHALKENKVSFVAFMHLRQPQLSSALTIQMGRFQRTLEKDGVSSKLLALALSKNSYVARLAKRFIQEKVAGDADAWILNCFNDLVNQKTPSQLADLLLQNRKTSDAILDEDICSSQMQCSDILPRIQPVLGCMVAKKSDLTVLVLKQMIQLINQKKYDRRDLQICLGRTVRPLPDSVRAFLLKKISEDNDLEFLAKLYLFGISNQDNRIKVIEALCVHEGSDQVESIIEMLVKKFTKIEIAPST